MAEKPKTAKERAQERMTDGGIWMVGDEIIHDGEGEKYGGLSKKDSAKPKWPDIDE